MNDTATLPLRLALWFEARLQESVSLPTSTVCLYGLELVDEAVLDDPRSIAARVCFLAEAADEMALVDADGAGRVTDFDAGATVAYRWLSPAASPLRPGSYCGRRRARVVQVHSVAGSATVVRFQDDPDVVVFASAA
jgi:hypothetical protein